MDGAGVVSGAGIIAGDAGKKARQNTAKRLHFARRHLAAIHITENPMKKMTRIAALLTFAGLLCACNTVQGFGQDVERAGQSVSNAAARAK